MLAELEEKREAIAAPCRRYGVVRMDVFGSAARDEFRLGESDVDLLVDFGSLDPFVLLDAYFREKRSAVEREFTTIGEAIGALADLAPGLFARITQARKVVGSRDWRILSRVTWCCSDSLTASLR